MMNDRISRQFSALARGKLLSEMAASTVDLLVIGGGITGAGIALDAASRGLTVALVEKNDFASGTSSKSTKLIHGGLRYLKQGEIKLVREVGRERAILYKNAPHIVIPEQMLLPLVKKGTYGRLSTSFGLWLYDALAGVRPEERRVMLSKAETMAREPLLRTDDLRGSGVYYEYRTDDIRLTIEVMKTALAYGALISNYAKVTSFLYKYGKIIGAVVRDELQGSLYEIHARTVVNATGPWVDGLRELDGFQNGKHLHLTKGVHLVIPYHRLPIQQSVYFDVPDGRMIFAIPRDGCTYIGTTDTDYREDIEFPRVTRADVDYLLAGVNQMFPTVALTAADIASSWAGLRPLIHEDGKSPSELSRKDETFCSPSGLISIAGGKLTGYRKMAERTVDEVVRQLPRFKTRVLQPCRTEAIVLSGGEFQSPIEIPQYIQAILRDTRGLGITDAHLEELVHRFGSNTGQIIVRAKRSWNDAVYRNLNVWQRLIVAQAEYCMEEEMATNLSDFFIRRTGHIFFHREDISAVQFAVEKTLSQTLGWRGDQLQSYKHAFRTEFESVIAFAD